MRQNNRRGGYFVSERSKDGGAQMRLIPEIKEKLEKWIDSGPSRSIAELARRSGVSYTSTRRMVQNEGLPSYNNLANILSVLLENDIDALPTLLKQQFPHLGRAIDMFLNDGVISDQNREALNRTINENSLASVIYAMSDSDDGTSLSDIIEEHGRSGLKALKELTSVGLIEESGGRYKTTEKNGKVNFPVQTIINAIAAHANISNVENIENGFGVTSLQWATANKIGYNKAIELTIEYTGKVKMALEANPGKIPVYFAAIGNSYVELCAFLKKENIK